MRRVVNALGRVLVGFGVIVLLFVVYLLWGTGIYTAQHQSALRAQICRELHNAKTSEGPKHRKNLGVACGASSGERTGTSTTTPSGTTTTLPTSGVQTPVPGDVPAEGQPIGIIQIPKIGLDIVVVEGTGTADLRLGPGHYPGTPLPGQPGNSAIAGHRTTYLRPFYNLNEMAKGDPIFVTTTQGRFEYDVTQAPFPVSPNDVAVIAPTSTPELTLTTCNPRFSASQRLVIQADLRPPTTVTPTTVPPPASPLHGSHTRPPRSASSGLAGGQGSWGGTLAWGAGFLALGVGVWFVAHRRHRRWLFYSVGAVPLLVVLYFFFENLSPLLPASY